MDDANAAFTRHGDRHFTFRHHIHVCGHDGDLQCDFLRQLRLRGKFAARIHIRILRHEQNIVIGQGGILQNLHNWLLYSKIKPPEL